MKGNSILPIVLLALSLAPAGPVIAATLENELNDSFGWKFEYDENGRIHKLIDPADRVTKLDYSLDSTENLRKLVIATGDGAKVIKEFDKHGRPSRMQDAVGSVSYEYDDLNRQNRVLRQGLPVVAYSYDSFGRIKNLSVGNFYHIEYRYDFLGRLESMNTPAGEIRYEYLTEQGRVKRVLPNGVETISEYEANGRLRRITHLLPSGSEGVNYQILADYSYRYRPNGLIESIQEFSDVGKTEKRYEYDQAGQLFRVTDPRGREYVFEYDQLGNRKQSTSPDLQQQVVDHDWLGRVKSINGAPSKHDAAGNLTAMSINGDTFEYRYDQFNQLTDFVNAGVRYRYDGDGQLIERVSAENKLTFTSNPISRYWQPLVITEKSGRQMMMVWDGNAPLIMIGQDEAAYLLHDHMGSVRLAVNESGEVGEYIDYSPYGSFEGSSAGNVLVPRFAGRFWDQQAKFYITRSRAYSSQLGRYLQIDPGHHIPLGSQKGQFGYTCCGNDPVNFVELDGVVSRKPEVLINSSDATASGYPGTDEIIDVINSKRRKGWFALPYLPADELAFWKKDWKWDPTQYELEDGTMADMNWMALYGAQPTNLFGYQAIVGADLLLAPTYLYMKQISVPAFMEGLGESKKELIEYWEADPYNVTLKIPISVVTKPFKKWFADMSRPNRDVEKIDNFVANVRGAYKGHVLWWQKLNESFDNKMKSLSNTYKKLLKKRYWRKKDDEDDDLGTDSTGLVEPGASTDLDEPDELDEPSASINTYEPGELGASNNSDDPGGPGGSSGPGGPGGPGGQGGPGGNNGPGCPGCGGGPGGGGGPWGGGGPRGPGGPGNSQYFSRMSPSPVGGIYLGGAGQLLESVGMLEGIVIDSNDNLILVSESGNNINLPPFRVDDLVTVFRSVYLHGEGPSVTIDPNPDDPESSAMIVRHGKGTANTYVGWVLFQADRLMKGYSLGVDNQSTLQIKSSVPGYEQVLDKAYFGARPAQQHRDKGHWERFWIVPTANHRYSMSGSNLTLFDVPLKVKTQTMKWEEGKLVDDLDGKSSPGALAFTDWFTEKYGRIAEEQYLDPPPGSGIGTAVPVFSELRRIALMTAIAEKLRDQGHPMPFWMRDYEVKPVSVARFTPGLEVTRSNSSTTARAFGGVELSAEDKKIRDFGPETDLSRLSKAEQKAVRGKLELVAQLDKVIQNHNALAGSLVTGEFDHGGNSYQTVTLPGNDTRALSPARIDEVDVSVPVDGGRFLRLSRHYNSFFDPRDLLGKGWTLDLPRVLRTVTAVSREGSQASHRLTYELSTPLNSTYARFSRIENVPELGNSRLLVPDHASEFFGLTEGQSEFLSVPTLMLIRKDGSVWHFSESGDLIATEDQGFKSVYERDRRGKLTRIIGLLGELPVAFIELDYDSEGNLELVKGRKGAFDTTVTSVRYQYDAEGRLSGVITATGAHGYAYNGSRIKSITFQPRNAEGIIPDNKKVHTFEYGPRGQLLSETAANGLKTSYRIVPNARGGKDITVATTDNSSTSFVSYDSDFRPVKARLTDGAQIAWTYSATGATVAEIKESDGSTVLLEDSADKRRRTLLFDEKHKIAIDFDEAGRLIGLSENEYRLLEQKWAPSGRLHLAKNELSAEYFEYGDGGYLSGIIQAPADEVGELKHWRATRYDAAGRPIEITDHRGMFQSIKFTNGGNLDQITTRRNGKDFGLKINRDSSSRIRELRSSWGRHVFDYGNDGLLEKLTSSKLGQKASAEWKSGLLRNLTQFDGSEYRLDYYGDGKLKNVATPNKLNLAYQYDENRRLVEVAIGPSRSLVLQYDENGNLTQWGHQAH